MSLIRSWERHIWECRSRFITGPWHCFSVQKMPFYQMIYWKKSMSKCHIVLYCICLSIKFSTCKRCAAINMVICCLTYDLSDHKNAMPIDRCMKIYCLGILTLLCIMCSMMTIIGLSKSLRGLINQSAGQK